MQPNLIFGLIILVVSVILHEVAHGYAASWLGDQTARRLGRLTLNPFSHIDPIGSIVLPALLFISGMPIIGYAKPVPYNPFNLRKTWGEGFVAAAGPLTNIAIVAIFTACIYLFGTNNIALAQAFGFIVAINLSLALFNLLPVPPLDGSKVFATFLPGFLGRGYRRFCAWFESLGVFTGTILLLFVFYYVLFDYFIVLHSYILDLLTQAL